MPRGVNVYDTARIQGRNFANADSFNIVSPPFVDDGLVMHLDAGNYVSYPGTGTNWIDLTGNGNNSVLTNGPTYNAENGGSIVFDGIDDYGTIPTTYRLNNPYATHEAWVKPASATPVTPGQVISRTNTSAGTFNIIQLNVSFLWQCNLRDGANAQTNINSNSTSTTNWQHVVSSYNGSTHNMYINGVKQTSETVKTNTINTGGTFTMNVGRNTTGVAYFNGRIAVVRAYDRGLTPEEIQQNFNATRARFGV